MKPAQANITIVNRPIYTMEWESEDWGKFKAVYETGFNDDLTVWWWDEDKADGGNCGWSCSERDMVDYGKEELAKMFLQRYGSEMGVSA